MVLTYSRVWVRQLLGGTVVGLQSEGLLPVESEDLGKGSRVVLGEDLTVTARENTACVQCDNTSGKVTKHF